MFRDILFRVEEPTVCALTAFAIEGRISSGLPCRTSKSRPFFFRFCFRSPRHSIKNCALDPEMVIEFYKRDMCIN
jgi:hypothetical protein